MDDATRKFKEKHPIYFSNLNRDWWFYDEEDEEWIVGMYVKHDPVTFKVTLRKGNSIYTVPIYRLFMKKPTDKSIDLRKYLIEIAGGTVMENPELKF